GLIGRVGAATAAGGRRGDERHHRGEGTNGSHCSRQAGGSRGPHMTDRPSTRSTVVGAQGGDLARPALGGLHSCGTAPDSHRTSLLARSIGNAIRQEIQIFPLPTPNPPHPRSEEHTSEL